MIAIASDHGGFNLKKVIAEYLTANKIAFEDFGTRDGGACDYPDVAFKAAESVARGRCELGVLLCGTGVGMSIAANKVRGVRAALCHDVFTAKMARAHNDAQILCMGERVTGAGHALEILRAFLESRPEDGRHAARRAKIAGYEGKTGK